MNRRGYAVAIGRLESLVGRGDWKCAAELAGRMRAFLQSQDGPVARRWYAAELAEVEQIQTRVESLARRGGR